MCIYITYISNIVMYMYNMFIKKSGEAQETLRSKYTVII